MIDLLKYFELENKDSAYISSVKRRYQQYKNFSELPDVYINKPINIERCSQRIKILDTNIKTIIDDQLNFVFNVKNYSITGYLSAYLLHKYFKTKLNTDEAISNVLYVDTNLVLDDYKKIMDINTESDSPTLTYSNDTLYKNLENAPFVIWDRFSMINSAYEKQKIYNILLIRYRQGLGNMYFMKNAPIEISRICDEEMLNILDYENIVNLENEQITFYDNEIDKGSIKW